VFITPHGIYYYTAMSFGLKNAGATYQKAIHKCLESQIGKNVEAYVDNVVVKTTAEDDLIAELTKTFGTTAGSSTRRSASSVSHPVRS
jgi:hypothetical protein